LQEIDLKKQRLVWPQSTTVINALCHASDMGESRQQ